MENLEVWKWIAKLLLSILPPLIGLIYWLWNSIGHKIERLHDVIERLEENNNNIENTQIEIKKDCKYLHELILEIKDHIQHIHRS